MAIIPASSLIVALAFCLTWYITLKFGSRRIELPSTEEI